jgi:Putative lumazine-binding
MWEHPRPMHALHRSAWCRGALLSLVAGGALAATALAACGGSDSDGVRETVRSYLQAVLDGDGSRACGLLTTQASRAFVQQAASVTNTHDCATAFHREAATLSASQKAVYRSAVLQQVTVTGTDATATVKFTDTTTKISLTKVGGDWRISTGPQG